MNRLLLVMLFFLFTLSLTSLHAQKKEFGKITGVVVNKDNQPIANVPIVLQTLNRKVVQFSLTDSTGNFSLDSLPLQKYLIEISMVGFQSYLSVTIVLLTTSQIDIQLKDSITNLSEVKVATKKKLFEMLPDKMVMMLKIIFWPQVILYMILSEKHRW